MVPRATPPMGKPNDYWCLPDYASYSGSDLRHHLDRKGYVVNKSAPKYQLIDLAQRISRGLLSYDNCDDDALRKFAEDRSVALNGARKRKDIIALLRQADDDQTFSRFLGLPPELRNRVYHFYIAWFPDRILTPALPPLACTSKQLTKEVDPLFLASKTVVFIFDRKSDSMTRNSTIIRVTPRSRLFMLDHAKEYFSDVRSFGIELRRWWPRTGGGEDYKIFCYITVTLDDSSTGFKLSVDGDMDYGDSQKQVRKQRNEYVRHGVSKVMKDVAGRNTLKKLKVDDIYAIRGEMETAFNIPLAEK